jgi:glutathionylspermidine synthase
MFVFGSNKAFLLLIWQVYPDLEFVEVGFPQWRQK